MAPVHDCELKETCVMSPNRKVECDGKHASWYDNDYR